MAGDNQKTNSNLDNSYVAEKKSFSKTIKETKSELKKVHWPSNEELKKYTMVVIATVAFFSVALYFIDSGLGFVISKLVSR